MINVKKFLNIIMWQLLSDLKYVLIIIMNINIIISFS